jgi:hypothetical protein
MNSAGGVAAQPVLGRAADVWGYPASYLMSSGLSALALPFIARARREGAPADTAGTGEVEEEAELVDHCHPAGPAADAHHPLPAQAQSD